MSEKVTLEDIFHSSGNTIRYIQYGNLFELMKHKLIATKKELIGSGYFVTWINRLIEENNALDKSGFLSNEMNQCFYAMNAGHWDVGGGHKHKMLSLYAAAFLSDNGYEVDFEKWRNGKRVDVVTKCNTWIIECGDTDACIVPEHLYRTCKYYAVMPFDFNEGTQPFLYVFERGSNWIDGYNPLDEDKAVIMAAFEQIQR